ncbi:ABC transporter ATP-binding protein [soil metagenome]
MQNIIQLSNVNLHYSSHAYRETSLKSYVFNAFKRSHKRQAITDVHALKNISISIYPGERVGLIGHNGAGKSTLLKTIAGLYPISSGALYTKGEIRSLFELYLGFEVDATGRENILYRGLLLGRSPRQMRQLEEEIVDFASLGEFIDYPIKTYSAGMQVRLAFAISTLVSGDILLLDEVIGAGDAAFMQKAKNKIVELVNNAEILVLASHDFSSMKQLCNRAIVLQKGEIIYEGDVDTAITIYNQANLIQT